MIRTAVLIEPLHDCRDTSVAGGKAVNLGRLIRAGFPVPEGFVVTAHAYRTAQSSSPACTTPVEVPQDVADAVRHAYRALGEGPVAVRSSATAEDAAAASMAGQCETFLDIEGESPLLDAVRRCWASLDAPRIRAYLHGHDIDPRDVAMAVVVQRMVPADVAGVLFTSGPHNGGRREMLIEASWGLGEAVVSGRVQPDALRLDRETGRVLAATIADKRICVAAGGGAEQPVDELRRRQSCLRGRDVDRLWQLGKRAAEHFGAPQDVEWAIHAGEVYLLQSRPITTLREADAQEDARRAAREHLRRESAAGRGPWVLHNLAETLPHPTPFTWSVVARFMSGAGGLGMMYRQAGFEPSPACDREGFLTLIAGRIYMDASRAPQMFFDGFPFAYDLEELKRSPDASQTPPTLPRGSLVARLKAQRRLTAVGARLRTLSANFDRQLRETLFPAIVRYATAARQVDLQSLSAGRLAECWQERERQVLDLFGPELLLPSLIAEMAMAELRTSLAEHFWDEDPDALAQLLSSGGPPDRTVTRDAELAEVALGNRPLETWLAEHGHRAPGEFDLAAPRWRQQPSAVAEIAARLTGGDAPLERYGRHRDAVQRQMQSLCARLPRRDREELERRVDLAQRYVAFREDGKDYLMRGYDLLRDVALEAGRRLDVGEDVFYLTRDELFDALGTGFAPHHLIERRKAAHQTEARLKLPRVIEEATIDVLGDAPEEDGAHAAGGHQAFAVSAGEASGPARILTSPLEAGELGRGYILVCPSTDPSWTPLFVQAAGLVLECGGALSHGAVVAREMGLPAVVLPEATRCFRDGEEIRVDGDRGWVGRAAEQRCPPSPADAAKPDDVRVAPRLLPPPAGRKDRAAAKFRNIAAAAWLVGLAAFFLLPEPWVRQPVLAAMDALLWPLVRWLGKPAVVAMIAAGMAVLTLVVQRFFTDNRRLLEAKRRAAALHRLANSLPQDSPRRAALFKAASPVPLRTLGAAMAPVGLLLGPMVLPFVWFQERIDPSVANAPAGSAIQVVALVDGDWSEPVQIDVPSPVAVDDATPAARTLPPLRKTLERLLVLYRQPRKIPGEAWELQAAPDLAREQTADDLQAYLAAGIPPQGITWILRPPEDYSGQFPVSIATPGHPPLTANAVLGDDYPPARHAVKGNPDSPLKELRVVCPESRQETYFWRPLASLGGDNATPVAARLAAVHVGWIWLYLLVYLPMLFAVRLLLRTA